MNFGNGNGGGYSRGFAPHEFARKIELLASPPRVLFTRGAFLDNAHLVDICPMEVGWMGHVRRVGPDFLIHRIFMVEQEVSGVTCELDSEAIAQYAAGCLSEPDGEEMFNSIRFWGHSHGSMGTSPSGQDEAQLHELASRGGEYFLRGIFNKLGRAEFTIALPAAGVWLRDAEWQILEPADEARKAFWQAEVASKVREKKPEPIVAATGLFSSAIPRLPDDGWEQTRSGRLVYSGSKKGGRKWGR